MGAITRRLIAPLLIAALLVSTSAGVALAAGNASDSGVTKLGSQDITISDATVTISDTNIAGPGFPDLTIDHQRYTLDSSTMTIDGLHVSFNGQTYEICHVDITLKNLGVTLDNVRISDSN